VSLPPEAIEHVKTLRDLRAKTPNGFDARFQPAFDALIAMLPPEYDWTEANRLYGHFPITFDNREHARRFLEELAGYGARVVWDDPC
jgi:hypothetical protein